MKTREKIRDYLLNRLDTPSIHIEGNTIKIAGFVTEPIFKMIFDQYNQYIKYKNCKII